MDFPPGSFTGSPIGIIRVKVPPAIQVNNMSTISSKSCLSILLDSGKSMDKSLMVDNNLPSKHSSSISKLDLCKSFINTYMCMRCAEQKTVEFSVTTFGQEVAMNENHLKDSGEGYENVNEVVPMGHPTEDHYHLIRHLEPGTDDDKADLVAGLTVTYDSLVNHYKGLSYNRVIVLITDAENKFCEDDEDFDDLDRIIGACQTSNPEAKMQPVAIHVIVIGKLCSSSNLTDVAELNRLENVKLLKEIARNTGGMYTEADDPCGMFWCLSKGIGTGTRPMISKSCLRFADPAAAERESGVQGGSNSDTSLLEIPILCWNMTERKKGTRVKSMRQKVVGAGIGIDASACGNEDDKEKVKTSNQVEKQSFLPSKVKIETQETASSGAASVPINAIMTSEAVAASSTSNPDVVSEEYGPDVKLSPAPVQGQKRFLDSIYDHDAYDDGDIAEMLLPRELKRDRTYEHPSDKFEQLDVESFVNGFKYGSKYIPMDEGSIRAMQLEGDAGLTVIGFLPMDQIPRHHFMDRVTVVQGSDQVPESQEAVQAISQALHDKALALIVRKVTRKDGDPHVAALIAPTIENGTLLLQRLPCRDDSRNYYFNALPRVAGNPRYSAGTAALSSYVDCLTLPKVRSQQLNPANSAYYRIFAEVTARMLRMPTNEKVLEKDSLHMPLAEILQNNSDNDQIDVNEKLLKLHEVAQNINSSFILKRPIVTDSKKSRETFSDKQLRILEAEKDVNAER